MARSEFLKNARCPFCRSEKVITFQRNWPSIDPMHDRGCLTCDRTWDSRHEGKRRRREVPR